MKYLIQRLDKTIKSFTSFTRYSLIILVLLTMSCTDKKQTAEPIVIEPIIAEVIEPEPVIASYDKGLDLTMLGGQLTRWYKDQQTLKTNPSAFYFQPCWAYHTIYWLSNQNIYYYVLDLVETNNITYSLDTNKQFESSFFEKYEYFDEEKTTPLLYVGSISELKRVYLNPSNNQLYLKELLVIDDSSILEYDKDIDDYFFTPISLAVYPVSNTYKVTYTNSQNDKFDRHTAGNWPLEYVGKLQKENTYQ